MIRFTFHLGCSLFLVVVTGNAAWGDDDRPATRKIQRYALLIGADDYAPPLSKLQYCYNDMDDLRAHLEISGFAPDNITFMNDRSKSSRMRPTKANILRELSLRLQLANKDDVVLVAFSGHGVHIDGQSYLCPTDANLDGTGSLVEINRIYDMMEQCPAGEKLLIVDACRNEPIVRGFRAGKLADNLALQVQAPPRGLIVMSSCEPHQLSAEDPELQHGVFMNYVIEGLEGPADTNVDIGGNNNGRISLDELYYYAHEKTKIHVARSHGIVQRPMMRGEMVGRFDLAIVPDESHVRNVVRREKKPVEVASQLGLSDDKQSEEEKVAEEKAEEEKPQQEEKAEKASEKPASGKPVAEKAPVEVAMVTPPAAAKKVEEPTKSIDSPLLKQGDSYLQQGDYENAIIAYTAIIDDKSVDGSITKEARRGRGAAFLSRGQKGDFDKALIDHMAAGLPGIPFPVKAATAELKVNNDVKGKVKQGQIVIVSRIVGGEWFWVTSVDGSEKLKGYIQKSALFEQPVVSTPVTTQPVPSGGYSEYGDYNNGGYQHRGSGYGNQWRDNDSSRRSTGGSILQGIIGGSRWGGGIGIGGGSGGGGRGGRGR